MLPKASLSGGLFVMEELKHSSIKASMVAGVMFSKKKIPSSTNSVLLKNWVMNVLTGLQQENFKRSAYVHFSLKSLNI